MGSTFDNNDSEDYIAESALRAAAEIAARESEMQPGRNEREEEKAARRNADMHAWVFATLASAIAARTERDQSSVVKTGGLRYALSSAASNSLLIFSRRSA